MGESTSSSCADRWPTVWSHHHTCSCGTTTKEVLSCWNTTGKSPLCLRRKSMKIAIACCIHWKEPEGGRLWYTCKLCLWRNQWQVFTMEWAAQHSCILALIRMHGSQKVYFTVFLGPVHGNNPGTYKTVLEYTTGTYLVSVVVVFYCEEQCPICLVVRMIATTTSCITRENVPSMLEWADNNSVRVIGQFVLSFMWMDTIQLVEP